MREWSNNIIALFELNLKFGHFRFFMQFYSHQKVVSSHFYAPTTVQLKLNSKFSVSLVNPISNYLPLPLPKKVFCAADWE